MTGPLFGVDSSAPVTQAFYEEVVRWAGMEPQWWGRYLGTGGHAATPLTKAEVAEAHRVGLKLALVFNDVDRTTLTSANAGKSAAKLAVQQAKAIGAPPMTTLFVDIEEGWGLTAAWLLGWAQGLLSLGYSPGIYCPVAEELAIEAVSALAKRDLGTFQHLVIWGAMWPHAGEWTARHDGRISPPPFARFPLPQVSLWQFAGDQFAGVDLDLLNTKEEPAPRLWVR